MAAPTETYIDPGATGSDHGGNAFNDGAFANATLTLTRVGAFTAATCQAGDNIWLSDNGSGEVTVGMYRISVRTDDDNVVLTADIRSGANDPVDVVTVLHDGTINLAWASVQHANDFTTRDAVGGDRMNLKAGTDDVLLVSLDFTTYGTPTAAAPWILQGYSAAAADGGVGGVDGGGGNFSIVGGDTLDYLALVDVHLHNTGTSDVISLDNNNSFVNCEIDNTTATGLDVDSRNSVINCYIHNCGDNGVSALDGTGVMFCTFENGAQDFNEAIDLNGHAAYAMFNVLDLDGASTGIAVRNDDNAVVAFNSVYSSAGTGEGIQLGAGAQMAVMHSNIVEGFSGVGGIGIELVAGSSLALYGNNAFFNCTARLTDNSEFILVDNTANDLNPLAASAFIDAAADDFRVKPSVQALGYPTADYPSLAVRGYFDMGALPRKSQMIVHPGMGGGASG